MRRRLSRVAVVACLVLLAAACRTAESSRPAPGRPASELGADGGEGPRRSAFDVMIDWLVSIGLGRRWRAGGGAELVDENKRRVPTGPNPLHNR